jgi:hypothetical protein
VPNMFWDWIHWASAWMKELNDDAKNLAK